jgi:glutamate racemase
VFSKATPLFVPIVEEGLVDTDITRAAAQYYLFELLDTGIDGLILGCTHYPLMMEVIQATMGNSVNVMDSAFWTAKEAHDILLALNCLADKGRDGFGDSVFYITDFTPNFKKSAVNFLSREIPDIRKIELEELCRHGNSVIQQQTII